MKVFQKQGLWTCVSHTITFLHLQNAVYLYAVHFAEINSQYTHKDVFANIQGRNIKQTPEVLVRMSEMIPWH